MVGLEHKLAAGQTLGMLTGRAEQDDRRRVCKQVRERVVNQRCKENTEQAVLRARIDTERGEIEATQKLHQFD